MRRFALLLFLLVVVPPLQAQPAQKRPMEIVDLFKFQRVSDPQVSPDGKLVVYVIGKVNLEANSSSSTLWLAATDGKTPPRPLTTTTKKDRHPRWSPDGKWILFESNRSGSTQLWAIALDGGEARQLTTISTDAGTGIWARDGKHIAFVSAVWPEFSEKPFKESNELNQKKAEEREKSPVKAKVFTKLFYRHWDEYVEDKRQHLFVIAFDNGTAGEPKDVTPGDRDAYPTSTTFSIGDDFCFSPDSKYLVYTAAPDRDEAWSTNHDICRVPITGGKVENLTADNKAADGAPAFSPDGKKLAYRAQKKAGYEADRWEIMVVDVDVDGTFRGQPSVAPRGEADISFDSFVWDPEGVGLLATADYSAKVPVFWVDLAKKSTIALHLANAAGIPEGMHGSLSVARQGRGLAFTLARIDSPNEIYFYTPPMGNTEARLTNVSQANTTHLAELDRQRPESVTVKGADGTPMQMWILKPPGFDAKKKWPLVYLVHGGPQGAWEDGWSYRWNPQLWAAQGYVVALPNPRGSTGFGQKYVDEISGDWGGKCYEDLMKGLEYMENQPYIDKERMASAGASFGGYMMNWFQGHTTKFKTLITHCSVYNFESMYATTDELWFDEWEHGGPPWGKNREAYEKHSPHKFAKNFKTPMLIIHNDLDFRCPVGQGHELFTTLQRLGIPSRFINFPDEGHWVLRPRNSEYWHREVFSWLKKYAPPGGKAVP